jgi:hypothetical protein
MNRQLAIPVNRQLAIPVNPIGHQVQTNRPVVRVGGGPFCFSAHDDVVYVCFNFQFPGLVFISVC